jgi:hypothetical protein
MMDYLYCDSLSIPYKINQTMIVHGEQDIKERSSISYCVRRDNIVIGNKLS